ncbi:programmed cell death protein, putative [Entamoeba invadens IP1]|uniref:programmed cell death protein, putative n=1 Tax=Entamoeba invadens IP1 TaxID=370355 RepID=UPI0002C3E089|nr:programmed cell death protein, putative [Entamoeba invadens IP1]ELP93307.1 programmed cell death protein, putative [Entamoeba invadens IP1]|eukprot:XP_004260078.1 programmed cell death protein, putative [Entamoeba invadens IP1]
MNRAQMQQYKEQQMREQEEKRQQILEACLDSGAKERLSSVRLVKPEKARQVEDMIMMMAQQGQMTGQINEGGLISLLDQVQQKTETKITMKHKGDDELDDIKFDDL